MIFEGWGMTAGDDGGKLVIRGRLCFMENYFVYGRRE